MESQRQEEMTGCSSHCHTRHPLASFTAIAIRCSGINQHSLNRSQFKCLFSTGYKKGVALLKVRPSFCRSVAELT